MEARVTQQSTLTALIHGESGVGKSDLADTIPGPRLILDAEGGSEYTPSWPKQVWNPNFPPPGMPGCEPHLQQCAETVRVIVQEWSTWEKVHYWLVAGKHPFCSIVLDSLTEIQKRCRDAVRGPEQMQLQHWGELLILMETAIRQLRDLAKSPYNPLMNVIILALTGTKNDRGRPLAQGALQDTLPGFVDLVGYMSTGQFPDGSGLYRTMLVQPYGEFVAKDRTKVVTGLLSMSPQQLGYVHIRDQNRPELGGWTLHEFVQALETRYQQAAPAVQQIAAPNGQLTPGGHQQ
jgi:hypothetical protein